MKDFFFNIAILIASIFLSFMVVVFYYRFYQPYFFPNIADNKNINNIIESNNTYLQELLLIKGIIPINSKSSVEFNTTNQRAHNYVRFFPSINREFGNQFTYSFWINKKNNNYSDKILFYRGDSSNNSPLVKFGKNSNELIVQFQTNEDGEIINTQAKITDKLFSITDHDTWFMITIIFKDYKKNNRESGIETTIYLNNALLTIHKEEQNNNLRITNSKFVILPDSSKNTNNTNISGELADIRYFNYALSYKQIDELYEKGFNNEVFKTYLQLQSNKGKQDKHKINMFNRIRNY